MAIRRDAELGTILGVWGHPDDEAYLSAALMAEAVDAGRRVVCVTATRGEGGFPDDDPRSVEERKAVRTAELAACLEVLGVTEHVWLDFADGGCDEIDDEVGVAAIAALIEEVQPDTILTFGPDGQTGHTDHIAVSRWTTKAFRKLQPPGVELLYATFTPEWNAQFMEVVPQEAVMMVDMEPPTTPADELALWYRADDELAARKVRALRSQASQVEPMVALGGVEVYTELIRDEFFRAPRDDDFPEPSFPD